MSFRLNLLAVFLLALASQQECGLVVGQVYFKKGSPMVKLANGGLIAGTVKFSRDGRPYNSFVGIPYATVEERFQEPTPITTPPWEGVLSATEPGPTCPQLPFGNIGTESFGDENCLNLNVYIPMSNTVNRKKGYIVMVWIHGGAFMVGDGIGYKPEFFMDENVIIVTLNYRLGVFGFLSTGDNVIPGNNGMKDIVVALKWVQENIRAFGGNPNSVTIFGESAGGAAVHYLILSPTTKGLFHRAISQSGSALNQWVYNPNPKKTAIELATYLKCQNTSSEPPEITSEEIFTCLKNVTTEELNRAQNVFKQSWPANLRPFNFHPTTEPSDPISSLTPFLSEPPISILTKNDSVQSEVPWMIGATEDEGAAMYAAFVLSKPELLEQINSDWENVALNAFDYKKYCTQPDQAQVSQKIKQFYFGDKEISLETRAELRNLMSDALFLHGVYRAAIETVSRGQKSPVYFYQYAYYGPFSIAAKMVGITGEEAEKVGHMDELLHLFKITNSDPGIEDAIKPDTPDEIFSKNLVRLWTSFAIYGKPKHTWGNAKLKRWKALSKKQIDGVNPLSWFRIQENPVSLNISQNVKDRMQFWDELWSQYFTPAVMSHVPSPSKENATESIVPNVTVVL